MTRLEDRQILVRDIEQACADGARLAPACALAGIDAGTLRRWKADDGLAQGSGRSIPAFHLLDALDSMPGVLVRYGGHRHAAGGWTQSPLLRRIKVVAFIAVLGSGLRYAFRAHRIAAALNKRVEIRFVPLRRGSHSGEAFV